MDDADICARCVNCSPLSPGGIIKYLDPRRLIFRKTSAGGHFGRSEPEFSWENTDKAKELAAMLKGKQAVRCITPNPGELVSPARKFCN
ncbi:MAG: hypothetical protein R3C56_24495 [Pirellulaceae bacterium]